MPPQARAGTPPVLPDSNLVKRSHFTKWRIHPCTVQTTASNLIRIVLLSTEQVVKRFLGSTVARCSFCKTIWKKYCHTKCIYRTEVPLMPFCKNTQLFSTNLKYELFLFWVFQFGPTQKSIGIKYAHMSVRASYF